MLSGRGAPSAGVEARGALDTCSMAVGGGARGLGAMWGVGWVWVWAVEVDGWGDGPCEAVFRLWVLEARSTLGVACWLNSCVNVAQGCGGSCVEPRVWDEISYS